MLPPAAASRSNTQEAAVAGSACTRALDTASASSAGPKCPAGSIADLVAEMAIEAGGELAAVDEQP